MRELRAGWYGLWFRAGGALGSICHGHHHAHCTTTILPTNPTPYTLSAPTPQTHPIPPNAAGSRRGQFHTRPGMSGRACGGAEAKRWEDSHRCGRGRRTRNTHNITCAFCHWAASRYYQSLAEKTRPLSFTSLAMLRRQSRAVVRWSEGNPPSTSLVAIGADLAEHVRDEGQAGVRGGEGRHDLTRVGLDAE